MNDHTRHVKKMILMYIGSFIAMFITMYAMVDIVDHIYININKVYMAGLMTAAMAVVNPITMADMYKGMEKLRWGTLGIGIISALIILYLIRQQSFVYDKEFLKSMIPHHSSAILMCEEANISNGEIKELCKEIVETHKEEINTMEKILNTTN